MDKITVSELLSYFQKRDHYYRPRVHPDGDCIVIEYCGIEFLVVPAHTNENDEACALIEIAGFVGVFPGRIENDWQVGFGNRLIEIMDYLIEKLALYAFNERKKKLEKR